MGETRRLKTFPRSPPNGKVRPRPWKNAFVGRADLNSQVVAESAR
jgi:hypothetical protein